MEYLGISFELGNVPQLEPDFIPFAAWARAYLRGAGVPVSVAVEREGGKVTVEGVCTHICRHGGRKIFLMGTDDTQVIRIEAGEKIGSFKPECVNNVVRVTGTLVEDRIDEAYLAEWELRLKDQIARQHGEGEAGCSAEHQARGESVASSTEKRIADFRARIADRKAKEGKEYLSFYHVDGGSYEVLK